VTPAQRAPAYPDHLRREVEGYLQDLRFSTDSEAVAGLEEAMRYSLLAGGKRIRPVLALATARAIGLPVSALPLAAALELIHTYSLIHDDLPAMDDDDLRRGRPTCHRRFGEDVAILAGDGLYAEAFRHVLHHQEGDPHAILQAVAELAAATGVGGMVGGQYMDVKGLAEDGTTTLRHLHELKTGRLIAAGVECVLLLGGEDRSPRLADFGSSPRSWACCSRSLTTSST
jgi:geranylgeranyl diphosphate synthase type II